MARERPAQPHEHPIPTGPEALRARGRRLTRQRRLIWEALVDEPDQHLSADAIVDRVKRRSPRVNPSTVYRTLELLVDEGLVRRSHLGRDRAYYEPAREHPHHHLVCDRCGAVTHVHDDGLGDLRDRLERSAGFELGERELTLHGLCAACRRAP